MHDTSPQLEQTIQQDSYQRLDKICTRLFSDYSRTKIKDFIEQGRICVNGSISTDPSAIFKTPQLTITLQPPPPVETHLHATKMNLDIIYEDDSIIVINKPWGLVVHPAPGHEQDTLMNGLLSHYEGNLAPVGGVLRPGLVHRLDKDTSGLLVVAKTDHAFSFLKEQFTTRSISRKYYAFVWGIPNPPQGSIETYISRHPIHRQKMAVSREKKGKHALTHYKTIKTFANNKVSLLACHLETGRTHQIRVHLSHKGYPLIGDPVYGHKKAPKMSNATIDTFSRQALHAFSLQLIHPQTQEAMTFEAPIPEDLQKLQDELETYKCPL